MRNLVAFVLSTAITALIGPSLAVALSADATPVTIQIAATATASRG